MLERCVRKCVIGTSGTEDINIERCSLNLSCTIMLVLVFQVRTYHQDESYRIFVKVQLLYFIPLVSATVQFETNFLGF